MPSARGGRGSHFFGSAPWAGEQEDVETRVLVHTDDGCVFRASRLVCARIYMVLGLVA